MSLSLESNFESPMDSTVPAVAQPWIWPEALQKLLSEGDEDFVTEIIEVFKCQTRTRLRLLREAVESGRMQDARAQAHTVKAGSSQVGAHRLAAVCLEIETGTGSAADTVTLVAQAELLFDETSQLITVSQRQ
jgi:HPt (histidine-containing phosphotransfer) domain-containing protein